MTTNPHYRQILVLAMIAFVMGSPASRSETLRIATQGSLNSLDPYILNETFSLGILSNVMEGLVRRDAQLRVQPALATRWQQLSPLHWRFHLRRGVRFHDGTAFSADDVIFSFARARQPGSQQKFRIPTHARIEKVDTHTVDIHLTKPNPILHADWEALLITSAAWGSRHNKKSPTEIRNRSRALPMNGTGPYRITQHHPGQTTHFAKNPTWWGSVAKTDHFNNIELHTIKAAQTRTGALLSGQVDLIVPAPVQDVDRINQTPGLVVTTGAELRTIFLNMDQMRDTLIDVAGESRNPLRDVRVRRAIYHAIDAKSIIRVVMRGEAVVATSLISPIVHPGISSLQRLRYDPAKARKLLRQAGYPNGFELPMDCPNDRYVNDAEICQAVAGMLGKIGISVRLNVQTKSLFFARVLSGGGYRSAFNLIGWTPGALDGTNVLNNVAKCRDADGRGGRFNLGGYCNARVDQLMVGASVETDTAKRSRMITKAFQIIHADAGFIPLHQQKLAWAMSNQITARVRADNQIRFELITPRLTRRMHDPS